MTTPKRTWKTTPKSERLRLNAIDPVTSRTPPASRTPSASRTPPAFRTPRTFPAPPALHALNGLPAPPALVTIVLALALMLAPATIAHSEGIQEAPEQAPAEDEPLMILAPETVSTIPFLALEQDHPDSYRVEFFTDHSQALARLIGSEADLLATGFNVGYSRYRDQGDLVHMTTPVWGVSALLTSREIEDLGELAGGTIYAPFEGSPIDMYLRAVLEEEGLEDQVDVSYAPFPQAAGLLSEGRAEAAVLPEPIASRVELNDSAYRFENLHEGWARVSGGEPRSPQVSVFAMRSRARALTEHDSVLQERLREIIADIQDDPEYFAQAFADELGFPEPVVSHALRNTLFDVPPRDEAEELIRKYADVMSLPEPGQDLFRSGE